MGRWSAYCYKEPAFKLQAHRLSEKTDLPFETKEIDLSDINQVVELMKAHDAIISCLPYHFNLEIAKHACLNKTHYFDLTEDVPTTKAIIKMSKSATSILAPQCGLAPGFIAIVGASLAENFDTNTKFKITCRRPSTASDRAFGLCLQLVTRRCRERIFK